MSSQTPSSSTTTEASTPKRRPPRRTLQSGFSLLSRGEPKIWLTGGMLVICMTMIIGLLTLILVNGLATFWPRQLDWLMLAGQQMDIGEPQASEVRKPDNAIDMPPATNAALETSADDPKTSYPGTGDDAAIQPTASPVAANSVGTDQSAVDAAAANQANGGTTDQAPRGRPSRFYRTANFDVTGRHYRWFEPSELEAAGIVQPEWALVIERLSWGRLFGLPSRLSIPMDGESDSKALSGLLATDALLKELSGALALPATTDDADTTTEVATPDVATPDVATPDVATPDVATTDVATTADVPSIEEQLSQYLTRRIDQVRSQQLRQLISKKFADLAGPERTNADGETLHDAGSQHDGAILFQAAGSDEWMQLGSVDQLKSLDSISAARRVWFEPSTVVERIAPVIKVLADNRAEILRIMRRISNLDRRLSDARVSVRQAELDTDRTVMNAADEVGPLVERSVALERLKSRIDAAIARADQEISDAKLVSQWREAAATYLDKTWAAQQFELQQEIEDWRIRIADHPPAIVAAVLNYEEVWRTVLLEKQPLEQEIEELRAAGQGYELTMSVPTDAQSIQLTNEDSQSLLQGNWSEASQAVFAEQGIQVSANSTQVQLIANAVTLVTFDDPIGGRRWLWHDASHHDASPLITADSDAPNAGSGDVWMLSQTKIVNCEEIVRLFPANRLTLLGKLGVYSSRWREFLLDDPREANTEGGVFPAIWGTVVMTLIMTLAVVPFGVIAALYLREYTRSGPLVSLVRISINNLAGVPSIVYGVFGLAFFCYAIGAFVDGGPRNADFGTLPKGSWYAILGFTVIVGVAAFLMSLLSAGPDHSLSTMKQWLSRIAPWLWLLSLVGAGLLIFRSPFFHGFYEARLPTPTFGKEGLLWAALTLALLTLPVVIVATEEALAAVPNSLREGSLACGASKWQTIYRIVLPHARPGILTGAILAMARGIGEVAPLMLVGALPVAPDLPLDGEFPYFHGSRSFMHLGYQIYWLGFQSQNSEASKPLVFTCTLLLILIVIALNLSAILLRSRLRRRFQGNQF